MHPYHLLSRSILIISYRDPSVSFLIKIYSISSSCLHRGVFLSSLYLDISSSCLLRPILIMSPETYPHHVSLDRSSSSSLSLPSLQLLITGHCRGTLQFWNITSGMLVPLHTFTTSKKVVSPPEGMDCTEEDSDEALFAAPTNIEFCPHTKFLAFSFER